MRSLPPKRPICANPLRNSAHTMIIGLPPAGLHRFSDFTVVIVWADTPAARRFGVGQPIHFAYTIVRLEPHDRRSFLTASTVFHKYYDYRSRAEPQALACAEHRAG